MFVYLAVLLLESGASPYGLVSTSDEGEAIIWKLSGEGPSGTNMSVLARWKAHRGNISSVSKCLYSGCQSGVSQKLTLLLATASSENKAKIWTFAFGSLDPPTLLQEISTGRQFALSLSLLVIPEGILLASSGSDPSIAIYYSPRTPVKASQRGLGV